MSGIPAPWLATGAMLISFFALPCGMRPPKTARPAGLAESVVQQGHNPPSHGLCIMSGIPAPWLATGAMLISFFALPCGMRPPKTARPAGLAESVVQQGHTADEGATLVDGIEPSVASSLSEHTDRAVMINWSASAAVSSSSPNALPLLLDGESLSEMENRTPHDQMLSLYGRQALPFVRALPPLDSHSPNSLQRGSFAEMSRVESREPITAADSAISEEWLDLLFDTLADANGTISKAIEIRIWHGFDKEHQLENITVEGSGKVDRSAFKKDWLNVTGFIKPTKWFSRDWQESALFVGALWDILAPNERTISWEQIQKSKFKDRFGKDEAEFKDTFGDQGMNQEDMFAYLKGIGVLRYDESTSKSFA
eukprot:CAMPEP_0115446902 /NCGR_PEP_ID=MMETSP0271-20121206/39687_1 /TAXON_ID=71861 /ORGANISM="Scrippsiella trochoidea, Strain CCMP3099" /LENGTH=367 /DNA_ID=CAMNT_0002872951 /DNA_START=54 /DNA_END=1154 /DNA_ORIENTATION=+